MNSVDDDIAAIRAVRLRSNEAIARHDVEGVLAAVQDDARIIVSAGQLQDGAAAIMQAFEKNFANPEFITFIRRTELVDINDETAAETGRWEGQWTSHMTTGKYLARWQRGPEGWRIKAELFIPLETKNKD